ncbi:unnamed protein product [Toxocara canis]|uniref:Proteasome activator complex subunit 4 n=1 Tax=Toxocara canis TaxID=6265 RepID=A0A183UTV5_TOXCA|nr:unnamed protein product [Toxocara canis]
MIMRVDDVEMKESDEVEGEDPVPREVVVDAGSYLRDKPKYQRTKRELSYLPFYDVLSDDAHRWLEEIKTGLAASVSFYAADSGLTFWLNELRDYLDIFHLRFSRDDHIQFIKFAYNIILENDFDHRIVHKACSLIKSLINEDILNRQHMTLEWRPLYELYMEVAYGRNERNLDFDLIKDVAFTVKEFFPLTATSEILAEIRPYVDVWNDYAMEKFVSLFAAFVPLNMSIEDHKKYGAVLWFDELWHFYNFVEMNSSWESRIQRIFSAISEYCPGYVDWTSKHTIIFSKVLRTLNLSVRDGKVSVGDGAGMGSETAGAEWIIWMLGGPNESAEIHLRRVIRCIESFLHPLHDGLHTLTLQSFLAALVNEMVRRVRIERVRRKTKHKNHSNFWVPEWMRLTDIQIESFVSLLLPSVTYSAFSTVETSLPSYILRYLAFLAPNLVLPQVLDLVYPSLSATTEPNRLKQSLECLVDICVSLVRDNGEHQYPRFNTCKLDWVAELIKNAFVRLLKLVLQSLILRHFHGSSNGKIEYREKSSSKGRRSCAEVSACDHGREPLRHHAVVLLDALVSAIDINDVVKLSLAFRIIESFFTLIPIVDCSGALEIEHYQSLSDEERYLCALTAVLPRIVTKLMNRIFTLISQLATAVPKDSTTCLDSICEVPADIGFGGEDELLINLRIQSAFRSLLNNSSSAIVELVAERVYNFVRTMQTENAVAADAICVLVQECTCANPMKYFPRYLNHVMQNLKELACEEKRHLEVLDAATMWYIFLGMVLFSVRSEIILKYRKECLEIHKQAISMSCCNAYQGACWSLTNVLTQLTEVYPLSERDRRLELDKPLLESLSIKNWGKGDKKDSIKIRWHVPDEEELRFAEELIDEFVYKEILVLQLPEKMDNSLLLCTEEKRTRDLISAIKRSLYIVEKLLFCVGKRLPNFTTSVIALAETEVPIKKRSLSAMPPNMKMFSFHGVNVRERVRETMHTLIDHFLRLRDDQSKNLERVTSILHFLTTRGSTSRFRDKSESSGLNYEDPVQGRRVELYRCFEERVFSLQKACRRNLLYFEIRPKSDKFTVSHLMVLKDLVLLGTNYFTHVRVCAQAVLFRMLSKFPNAKTLIVKDIVKYLDPSAKTCHEEMKGALYMLIKGGFVVSTALSVRCRCWLAIAKIKYSEKPSIIALVERAYSAVSVEKWSPAKNVISQNLRASRYGLLSGARPDNEVLNWYRMEAEHDLIRKTKVKFEERMERQQKWTASLRRELIATCSNKRQLYHWRNVDCARSFLFTLHRNNFDVAALKVFLQMLTDDRLAWRQTAAECVSGWMAWNKPKSLRTVWTPPRKVQETENRLACGVRMDNLCIVYDEKHLPSNDNEWNRTVFVSKPHWGAYHWPKKLLVNAPFCKQCELKRTFNKLNAMEKVIISSLLDGGLLRQWHSILLKDKEDNDEFCNAEFLFIKYLFRNYYTVMLPVLKSLLESIMKRSEKSADDFLSTRAKKRLAAVYCSGLIRGSRNWPYSELSKMWAWLKPLMITQIEGLTSETVEHWETALKLCFDDVDLRRLYWLVEGIFEIAIKPSPTSWHACMRLAFIYYISTCASWRTTSLLRKALKIAGRLVHTAALATERTEIARILSFPAVFAFAAGSQTNIPRRFVVPSLQQMMLLFGEERLIGMKTLLAFINSYYTTAFVALSPAMISLFPLMTHLANEETAE